MIMACSNQKEEHGHDHGGLEPLAYTLYSDKTEIFVEFKPLIVGTVSKFAAHFTVLGESFKPLTEGTVTVSLIVNGMGLKQTSDSPAVPGIYRLALQPKVAGKGDLIFDIVTKTFTDRQIIKDIEVFTDEKSAEQKMPVESKSSGEITYLKEQAWKVDFANIPVTKQPFTDIIKTTGYLKTAPGDEVVITAKSAGTVLFGSNNIVAGATVRKGDQLFIITGGNFTQGNIDSKYQESVATFEKTKADYDRAKELITDKIISQREFDEAKLAFETARLSYDMLNKNYSSSGLRINSTLDGFVNNITISSGQYVEAGTAIATITTNKNLILQANLSQRYFDKLSKITSANFIVPGSDSVYDIERLNGRLKAFGKGTATNTAFIPVTFEFRNPGYLISGVAVEAFLRIPTNKITMVIPRLAIIEEQGNLFVYVQTGGESFEKREIITGATDGENIQVVRGLNEGERIVTKGAYQIKLSSASGTLPAHGHEH
jgi:RND family efflux transporter MFP subunit